MRRTASAGGGGCFNPALYSFTRPGDQRVMSTVSLHESCRGGAGGGVGGVATGTGVAVSAAGRGLSPARPHAVNVSARTATGMTRVKRDARGTIGDTPQRP